MFETTSSCGYGFRARAPSGASGMTTDRRIGPPAIVPRNGGLACLILNGAARMDPDHAAEIHMHLLDVAAALDRATQAMFKLDRTERQIYSARLLEVHDALHLGLLRALYAEHPELTAHDPPAISSTLRWEDVSLPDNISAADVDAVIFEVLTGRLQKVARVVSKALERCQKLDLPIEMETIGARIVALVEAGRIESAGDPRMWRHSEVRLRH